jgi:hypothetical protein
MSECPVLPPKADIPLGEEYTRLLNGVLAVLVDEDAGGAVDVDLSGYTCRTMFTAARASEAVMSGRA